MAEPDEPVVDLTKAVSELSSSISESNVSRDTAAALYGYISESYPACKRK